MLTIGDTRVGFLGLLTLLFIGLKLGHVIDWSWFWVLAPMTLPLSAFLFFIFICAFIAGLSGIIVKTIDAVEAKKKGK